LSGKDIDSIIVDVSRSQKSVSLINEANISISDYISKVGVSAYESKLYPPNSLSE
jgi:hypothetical protein